MRKAIKLFIIAAFFIILGGILCAFSFVRMGNSLEPMSFAEMETDTIKIEESFQDINIKVETGHVTIKKSDDGVCSVECYQDRKAPFEIKTQDGTLSIGEALKNDMAWYEKASIFASMPKVVVSLPKESYKTLIAETDTGQITVKGELAFDSVSVTSDTGDLTLSKVTSTGAMQVRSDTGNVEFEDCDAGSVTVDLDTGNIVASFRSGKTIEASTDTGRMKIPEESTGGMCKMTTDTGDIEVTIAE